MGFCAMQMVQQHLIHMKSNPSPNNNQQWKTTRHYCTNMLFSVFPLWLVLETKHGQASVRKHKK